MKPISYRELNSSFRETAKAKREYRKLAKHYVKVEKERNQMLEVLEYLVSQYLRSDDNNWISCWTLADSNYKNKRLYWRHPLVKAWLKAEKLIKPYKKETS